MARPLRIEFAGAVQHIISRGNAGQDIFSDQTDFTAFLAILANAVDRCGWVIYAYCLMPNHYHLAVETPQARLSEGMQYLNGVYTQRFNRRHDRIGHLLQGRFKSILVDRHAYLLELCRYVVLNPVRAGLVTEPQEWRWSSFAPAMGKAPKPRFLDPGIVFSMFADDTVKARESYSQFVVEGIGKRPPWDDSGGGIVMGDQQFLKAIMPLVRDQASAEQLARLDRLANRPPLEEILGSADSDRLTVSAIRDAHVRHGYSLRDIADFLNIHPSTLTKMAKRGELKVKTRQNSIC